MKRTWILLKAQIINFFPINEIRESGNKKKNTAVILGFGVMTIVLFLCIYNILIAQSLVKIGEQELIPAYMVSISSFAILLLTMFRSNGILFGSRDTNMLASLPIKNSEIICSKFLFLYLLNFLIGAVFMIPGGIIWTGNIKIDILHFVFFFLSIFFVPLIPMCLASIIGVFIVFVSSHFKNKNIISVILSFAALGWIGYIAFKSTQTKSDISDISIMIARQITGLYPFSKFFLKGSSFFEIAGITAFIILSIAIFYLFIKIVAIKYNHFNILANNISKYTNYKTPIKRRSQFISLYQKEFGRFFNSYMAVLNTCLGVILLCFFGIFLLAMSPQKLGQYIGIEDINGFLSDYAPIVVAAMLSLSCPTASSISLEGKNIWILQSSPVSIKMIIDSKIAVNLTLHILGYLLSVFAIITRINMTTLQVVSLLCIPVCYSIFIVIFGIFLNKKYPNYEWDSEVMVVKQSVPAIITSITAMVLAAMPMLFNWIFSFSITPILWGVAVSLIIFAIIMYRKVCTSNYI